MHRVIDERHTAEGPIESLAEEAITLLKQLISNPSFSGNEEVTANLITTFLAQHGISCKRHYHNVWGYNKYHRADKPTILLVSHHDTAVPNSGYSRYPFDAEVAGGRLYGLGSNEAVGALVALLATFCFFYNRMDLPYNLCFVACGEDENAGKKGISAILYELGKIDLATVGEPTTMAMATAEMGCMVLDCTAYSHAGDGGANALHKALSDIQWFSTYQFPKQSAFMGPITMAVTGIQAGLQNKVMPGECHFTVDVRLSDCYTVIEVLDIIGQHTTAHLRPRASIVMPCCIEHIHPIVRTGVSLGCKTFISPASSCQCRLGVPSVKMGPGDPSRSYMPDEYILIDEITDGISAYINLLESMTYCLINNQSAGANS